MNHLSKGRGPAGKKGTLKKKLPRMTADEKCLVREMHFDRHIRPAKIASVVGRSFCHLPSLVVCRYWLDCYVRCPGVK